MRERQRTGNEIVLDANGEDPQEERLRAVFAAAYPPVWPPESLRKRVEEVVARPPTGAAARPRWWLDRIAWRPAACGLLLSALLASGSFLVGLERDQSRQRLPVVKRQQITPPAAAPPSVLLRPPRDQSPLMVRGHQVPKSGGFPRLAGTGEAVTRRQGPERSTPTAAGDIASGSHFAAAGIPRGAMLSEEEWVEIEARVRRAVGGGDDFVHLPFPRLADVTGRQMVAATEKYQREAAIVDPRLSREVTLRFKATALSDLCEQLRAETGIRLEAGRSVADEKVTVFSSKMPLREVMRQLSRPFGYTWLRSKRDDEYRYELIQDLKSQLLEEELRNRDRHAALLALEQEIERYRPYLHLSPDEALARAKSAPPEEKQRLEVLADKGWGPLQMYFRLSTREKAALRAGQTLTFSVAPGAGELPLPPDVARGVLQSYRDWRVLKTDQGFAATQDLDDPEALPLTTSPDTHARVRLSLHQSELGQFTINHSGAGFSAGEGASSMYSNLPLATGVSPAARRPNNAAANARLAHEPEMRSRVSFQPRRDPTSGPSPARRGGPAAELKVTTADVLEALHRATGLPIVADYYTRLFPAGAVSAREQPLFDALNQLGDTMRLQWRREDGWLQLRSASYYNDRLKEIPNRLLHRWAASRQQHGALTWEDLVEIGQLSDAQLDGEEMAEGARLLFGLEEWDLVRDANLRPHLRFLACFTPVQRQKAQTTAGLAFRDMSLGQQQQFTAQLASRLQSLEEMAHATLHVEYTQPGWYRLNPRSPTILGSSSPLFLEMPGVSPVRERTRAAALQAARRIDPSVSEAQIGPTELGVSFQYSWGEPQQPRSVVMRLTPHGWGLSVP